MRRAYNPRPHHIGLFLFLLVASWLAPNGSVSQAKTLAYWRFEDGRAGAKFDVGHTVAADSSGEGNALAVFNTAVQPIATTDVPFGTIPQTGAGNTLAADFKGRQDFYTLDQKVNNFNFSPSGSNAWTIEFSVRMRLADGVCRLLGRDGNSPNGEKRGPLQIVAIGDGEQFDIRVEMLDGQNHFRNIVSQRTYQVGRWYNVAVTANATTVSLYIDQLDSRGYQKIGTRAIDGALTATTGAFSIGRGWNGRAGDWIEGKIDEVRVSDVALQPSQFLFTSPESKGVVAPPPVPEPKLQSLDFPLFWGADPEVDFFQGMYWMYMTGHDASPGNPSFFAYSSPDLKNWKEHKPVLQYNDIAWITPPNRGAWAPGVASKNGKYYFYYSVGPQTKQQPSRIGVAVGDSPAGPFKDKGEPLLVGGNGFEAIDPMVFNDPSSGKSYLYAGGSAGAKLRVFEMNPDMMSFSREIPVETPSQFTEGPFMHLRDGIYYLSYSHGSWRGESYSVHYATSTAPYGPWQYRGAILVSDETRKGPGHHSFVENPKTKQWFIVYHRWQNPKGGHPLRARARSIAVEPICYEPNGDILPITMSDSFVPLLHMDQPPAVKKSVPLPSNPVDGVPQ